jgi:Tfp pilus assembly protein PilF
MSELENKPQPQKGQLPAQPNNGHNSERSFVNKLSESHPTAEKGIEKADSLEAKVMYYEARKAYDNDDISDSLAILRKIISLFPDFSPSYYLLARIYQNKFFEPQQAFEYYQKCLKYTPEFADFYLDYGYFLYYIDRYEDAKKMLTIGLSKLGMNRLVTYETLARIAELEQNFDKAVEYYEKTLFNLCTNLDGFSVESLAKEIERCREKKIYLGLEEDLDEE